MTDMYK